MHTKPTLLRTSLLWAATVVLAAGLLSGCGIFSPDETKDKPVTPPDFPAATTPDLVVQNFQTAYRLKNVQEYDKLLDENFVFYFAQTDVDQLGVEPSWDRAKEMDSATKMFTGQSGTTPGGEPQEPIQSFSLTLTPETTTWDDNVPAQYAGTQRRSYNVNMTVTFVGGATVAVRGIQDFYVAAVDAGGQTIYKLKYWVDFGIPGA